MTTEGFSVETELRALARAFDRYRELPGPERSGETSKKLVQVPLQEFFARGLPPGFRGGDGDRPPNRGATRRGDMDIVIDDVAKEWHGRSRFLAAGETVQVHMEVAAYAAWDDKKVAADLDLLHRSIDAASAAGTKPWTSLVLVGGEWKNAKENIAAFLHDYYHERWSHPRHSAPPFVNAVIVPGMYLMGHWMFEEMTHLPPSNTAGTASWEVVWAAMMEHPLCTRDDLVSVRPLALARAFLHRYLRSTAAGRVLPQLWSSDAEERDVVGSIDGADALAWAERSHCFCLEDGAPTRLYHYGPQTYLRDSFSTCGKKSAYHFTLHDPALREGVAWSLFRKARVLSGDGKNAEEIAACDELVMRFNGATEPALRQLVAWALFNRGCVLHSAGKNAEAIAGYEDVVMRFGAATGLVLRELVARALFWKARVVGIDGRIAEAKAIYDDLIARFAEAPEPEIVRHVELARTELAILSRPTPPRGPQPT